MPAPSAARDMSAAIIANLPKKTGKTFAEWVAILRAHGPQGRRHQVVWLKREHGLGQVTHRIALGSADAVDGEVPGWLRAAYEARS